MNVIVSNLQQQALANLDIDIIKSVSGEFEVDEIIDMFKNFFFGRMILDVTAIKEYENIANLQKLSINLDVEKIIMLLPNDPLTGSTTFLSKLVSLGIYNFTTNVDGVKYLLDHPNSYRDVAHIQQISDMNGGASSDGVLGGVHILGIKNITEHAGSTTLIYLMKKELEQVGLTVSAIEVDKRDFQFFNDSTMVSTTKDFLPKELLKQKDVNVILIDLNEAPDDGTCTDVLYLLEPSILSLNRATRRNRRLFEQLKGKKIVLNRSFLSNSDVMDFEYESKSKIFYNMPPLNDRLKSINAVRELLGKLGIIRLEPMDDDSNKLGKLGGLFGNKDV